MSTSLIKVSGLTSHNHVFTRVKTEVKIDGLKTGRSQKVKNNDRSSLHNVTIVNKKAAVVQVAVQAAV